MLDHNNREIWEGMDADEAEWPQPEHRTSRSGGNRLWSDRYKEARQYLYGSDEVRQDFAEAFRLFLLEAESGNLLVRHDLGRMLADGLGGKSMQPQHRNGMPKRWRHSMVWSRQKKHGKNPISKMNLQLWEWIPVLTRTLRM